MQPPITFETDAPSATEDLAAELARHLKGYENILLYGELGSGKTTFVRGLVRGLGGNPRTVASPSFVIVHVYAARCRVYHVDLYRLYGLEEIQQAGVLDLLEEPTITVVEWADRLGDYSVHDAVRVFFTVLGETRRRLSLTAPTGLRLDAVAFDPR